MLMSPYADQVAKVVAEEGVKVVSLAIVDAIEDGNIRLRDD